MVTGAALQREDPLLCTKRLTEKIVSNTKPVISNASWLTHKRNSTMAFERSWRRAAAF